MILQVMAVRFDLSDEEISGGSSGSQRKKEHLDICVLKYGANGVLEVCPDFTRSKKPYRTEVPKILQ